MSDPKNLESRLERLGEPAKQVFSSSPSGGSTGEFTDSKILEEAQLGNINISPQLRAGLLKRFLVMWAGKDLETDDDFIQLVRGVILSIPRALTKENNPICCESSVEKDKKGIWGIKCSLDDMEIITPSGKADLKIIEGLSSDEFADLAQQYLSPEELAIYKNANQSNIEDMDPNSQEAYQVIVGKLARATEGLKKEVPGFARWVGKFIKDTSSVVDILLLNKAHRVVGLMPLTCLRYLARTDAQMVNFYRTGFDSLLGLIPTEGLTCAIPAPAEATRALIKNSFKNQNQEAVLLFKQVLCMYKFYSANQEISGLWLGGCLRHTCNYGMQVFSLIEQVSEMYQIDPTQLLLNVTYKFNYEAVNTLVDVAEKHENTDNYLLWEWARLVNPSYFYELGPKKMRNVNVFFVALLAKKNKEIKSSVTWKEMPREITQLASMWATSFTTEYSKAGMFEKVFDKTLIDLRGLNTGNDEEVSDVEDNESVENEIRDSDID